jgi:hypothetical protein
VASGTANDVEMKVSSFTTRFEKTGIFVQQGLASLATTYLQRDPEVPDTAIYSLSLSSDCPVTTADAEDCDVGLSQMINGAFANVLSANDSDGKITLGSGSAGSFALTLDGTGPGEVTLPADVISLADLDDGSDTPSAGECLKVASAAGEGSIDYAACSSGGDKRTIILSAGSGGAANGPLYFGPMGPAANAALPTAVTKVQWDPVENITVKRIHCVATGDALCTKRFNVQTDGVDVSGYTCDSVNEAPCSDTQDESYTGTEKFAIEIEEPSTDCGTIDWINCIVEYQVD